MTVTFILLNTLIFVIVCDFSDFFTLHYLTQVTAASFLKFMLLIFQDAIHFFLQKPQFSFQFCHYFFLIFKNFLLEYSCFTMYSKMNQPYINTHCLPFGLLSPPGHHSALTRAPCAIQQILISSLFYTQYQWCMCVDPNLTIPPIFSSPLGIHTFVLYICVSVSALQV